jgi:glycosyltransferase involved in cell wall biosynthesis
MHIGVDVSTWSNRRGYGRLTRELITHMITEAPRHRFTLVADRQTALESEFPKRAYIEVVATREQPTRAASATGSRTVADILRMSRAASRLHADVFFYPTNYSFFPLWSATPSVVIFHDATAERHPELIFSGLRSRLFWRLKNWVALRQARRVVTVSENAMSQIAKMYGQPAERIRVITEGPSRIFQEGAPGVASDAILNRYGLPPGVPLILYVGGLSPHKNLHRLLQAVAKLPREAESPWRLVVVGDYQNDSFLGCHSTLAKLAIELNLMDRVVFTGFVPDNDLVLFYHAATMLVLPSIGEGFGLPVVEAMASGLPVVVSTGGSLPEIAGSACVLFDPLSVEQMAAAIRRTLQDKQLREELRRAGLKRAKLYSWNVAAHRMIDTLEELARDTHRR